MKPGDFIIIPGWSRRALAESQAPEPASREGAWGDLSPDALRAIKREVDGEQPNPLDGERLWK